MSAIEWLDGVRANLEAATPGPWRTEWDDADKWHSITGAGHDLGGGLWRVCPEVATVEAGGDADARLIASAPERLDRMEKALRGVMEMPVPDGRHRADLRFVYAAALDDVRATIREELSDE